MYQWKSRLEQRRCRLHPVREMVLKVRRSMPRLGTRKLYHLLQQELCARRIKLGRDGLFRYLRTEGLLVKPRRSYTKTTYSKHWLRKHPNLLKETFAERPEDIFVSDITYVPTDQGTHYLSLVTDACSRKIMGYEVSAEMKAADVVKALKMAIKTRQSKRTTIHHSDRGLQYCSHEYQATLNSNGMVASMTDGYDCYQNALAERINGILKQEFLLYQCEDGEELKKLVAQSVHTYNTQRPHLSLGYKTPNQVHEKASCLRQLA